MALQDHSPRYIAASPEGLRIVPLDELTAIYHRASGQTHVVASPVPEILDALREPMTVAQLLAMLSATFELGDSDHDALAARIDELVACGLVARA